MSRLANRSARGGSPRVPFLIGALMVAALTACQSTPGAGSDPDNSRQLELISWWAAGPDKAALEDVIEGFREAEQSIQVFDASVRGNDGSNARSAISARLEAGNPPDTFLTRGGPDLAAYVRDGVVADLTTINGTDGLQTSYPAAVLESVSEGDALFAIPVVVHRANLVWFDRERVALLGASPAPADIRSWLTDLETARSTGIEFPLAVGNGASQLSLFEAVLLADAGPELFGRLWLGADRWEDPSIVQALDHYGQLLDYIDPSLSSASPSDLVQQVIRGDAVYVVWSDAALPVFSAAGLGLGEQFDVVPGPGSAGVFSFGCDAFAVPVAAAHADSAAAWVEFVDDPDVQLTAAGASGGIAARIDADSVALPPYQNRAQTSYRRDLLLPSLSLGAAANQAWTSQITQALMRFESDGRRDALRNALISAAHLALD